MSLIVHLLILVHFSRIRTNSSADVKEGAEFVECKINMENEKKAFSTFPVYSFDAMEFRGKLNREKSVRIIFA